MPYNPLTRWPITNDWAGHMSYSAGGEDYPTPYGTELGAPAKGYLYSNGGSGEFKAGWVGTAGRRSILILSEPIDDCVAVVVQHLSEFLADGEYAEGETAFVTGASANLVDWGGDVHAHIHGLTASGARVPFTKYFSGSTPASNARTELGEDEMDLFYVQAPDTGVWLFSRRTGKIRKLTSDEWAVQRDLQKAGSTVDVVRVTNANVWKSIAG